MTRKRASVSILDGTLGYTTYQQHIRKIRLINTVFFTFGIFAVMDFFAGVFMLATIKSDHDKFKSFADNELILKDDCLCNAGDVCWADSPASATCGSAGLCHSLQEYQNRLNTESPETTERLCEVSNYVASVDTANLCTFQGRFDGLIEDLDRLWLSYLVFVVISAFITLYYLGELCRKWRHKLKTVPLPAPGRGGEKIDGNTRPYFAPPLEDWPGKPAAPTYVDPKTLKKKSKDKRTVSEDTGSASHPIADEPGSYSCEGCELRDIKNEIYCRTCGRTKKGLASIRPIESIRRKRLDTEEILFRKNMERYIQSFLRVAGVRIGIILLENIPQAIMVIVYIVTIDQPAGLACMECSTNGRVCEFGSSYDSAAVWLLVAGQVCSVCLLMCQVLYIRVVSDKTGMKPSFCGTDMFIALVSLPAAASPVLIALLVTPDAKEIANIGDTAEIVMIVVVCVFMLPWLVAAFVGVAFCSEFMGLDAICFGCTDCCDCGAIGDCLCECCELCACC